METHTAGFHKLFKILYFAEKKHLALYGRSILGDRYVAMQAGPVPSNTYDLLKVLRGDSLFSIDVDLSKDFEVSNNHYVHLLEPKYDYDIFSESEIECLKFSIAENKNLTFGILKEKSHDEAWKSADKEDTISIFEIAKAGGANEELLKYISTRMENRRLDLK